ncbi:MAG TPA: glycosyltransferase family 39 protein [Candidatus Saccharimonadales bacterium]|nr:glycosyltransferase family 39 protein [Candidatus Saccharimonadales bacterium]
MKKSFTKFIRNHSLVTLSVIYLITRLVNLTRLPIFNDEAIYLDWGWKSLHTNAGLFYSLYDAKPPFLIWIFGIFESLFGSPLFVGRFVSVLAGLLTLIGIYKVARNLESEKTALLSSALYITVPLFVFFDRQALMESAITAAGVWGFYLLLQTTQTKKTIYPIYLGIIIGVGIFIKLQALVFLVSIILILIYKKLFKPAVLAFITALVTLSPLLIQGTFWASFSSNNRFMLSIPEIFSFPFALWIKNFSTTVAVSFFHLTPFIFLMAIYGIYLSLKSKKGLLPVYFLLGIVFIIFLGRSLSVRYVTSFLVFASIFCSYAILSFKKIISIPIGSIAALPALIITALLIFSPLIYFNVLDKVTTFSQKPDYVTGWTSGYGIPETVDFLSNQSKANPIVVGVRLDAGNPESAMFAYFNGSDNVFPKYLDLRVLDPSIMKSKCLNSPIPVYFVARDGILNGLDKFFQEVARFEKPEREHFISILTLTKCN